MLEVEKIAINKYNAKEGKFLVLVNDKDGYHLECTTNRLAKIPLIGRIVTWYYERKLPAVVQYLLSDVSGFEGVPSPDLRDKVKATIDRFFESKAHHQSNLRIKTAAAYKRAFEKNDFPQPKSPENPEPVAAPEPVIVPEPEPVIVPEPEPVAAPVPVVVPVPDAAPALELTPEQKHEKWVEDFEKNYCVMELTVRKQFPRGLKIDPEFAEDLKLLLNRQPNVRFFFTWVSGRTDPNAEQFKEAVKNGPEDALWVLVGSYYGICQYMASQTFKMFGQHPIFMFNLGRIEEGLGYKQDKINKGSFENILACTQDKKSVEAVAASTQAIRQMS